LWNLPAGHGSSSPFLTALFLILAIYIFLCGKHKANSHLDALQNISSILGFLTVVWIMVVRDTFEKSFPELQQHRNGYWCITPPSLLK
jgi:hypothetical protein